MWVMNGTTGKSFNLGVVSSNWSIAAVGDFDNNGSTDLLWRDTSGNVGVWLMNGTAIQSTGVIANAPSSWTIANTGDYNGDGKSDIMWMDNLGNVGVWLIDGATVSTAMGIGNVGATWSAQVANAN
jgi:hypothetical protein